MENLFTKTGIVPIKITKCHPSFYQNQVWCFRVGHILFGSALLEKETLFNYRDKLIEFPANITAKCDMNFQGGLSNPIFGIRYGSNYLESFIHPENPVKSNTVYNFIFTVDY